MSRLYLILIALFLAAPLAVLLGVSVNEKQALTFPPQGFSLRWWAALWTDPGWRAALGASVALAALSAALALAIAAPLAWFLWRRIAPVARVLQALGAAPFILPPVITALGFLSFWATSGAYGQPWTAVVSHAVFFVTLPLVTLTLGLASVDRDLTEAAATMGAGEWAVLRTVVAPLVLPYAVSGYAFAFVLSLNEYIVAYMTVGFTVETVPIKIFNALRYGYTPVMATAALAFAAAAAAIFGLVARYGDLPRLLGALGGRDR